MFGKRRASPRPHRVGFPEGGFGDAVVEKLGLLDVDGLEALHEAKRRLERRGIDPGHVMGVLGGRIELGSEPLGAGGWHLALGARRGGEGGRSVDLIGLERGGVGRPRLERAAREAYGLPLAPLEWLEGTPR